MTNLFRILLITLLFALSGVLGIFTYIYFHPEKNTVHNRETYHYPASFVKQLKNDKEAGKKIFQEFCASCHAKHPAINVNAPRIGDKKTWNIKRKMGMNHLLKITINGVGAMPARGGCFECSDEQLYQSIEYILQQSSSNSMR